MRIYLCDDNPQYRQLARLVLEPEHEVVGESANGEDAVRNVAAARPDVILLDLNMPVLSGYQALGPLRAALPGAKIVILTSGRPEDDRADALAAGADGFIAKPESIFALPTELQRALGDGRPTDGPPTSPAA